MEKLRMINQATKEDISRWNYHYSEYEKYYDKYVTKLKIFTYGFYIGMTLWMCGLVTSMIVENLVVKISMIFIPLAIYQFFTIGKGIIEDRIKKGRY
jgi:hypothetical protein